MLTTTDDGLKNQENDFDVTLVIDEKLHKNRLSARWLVFIVKTTTTTLFTTNSYASLDNVSDKLICSRTRCTFRVNIRRRW